MIFVKAEIIFYWIYILVQASGPFKTKHFVLCGWYLQE